MPHACGLLFLAMLLCRLTVSLSVHQLPALQTISNETMGALHVSKRCPPVNQLVDFEEQYYDGKRFQRVTIVFSSGVFRRQPVSQGEMRAVITCYTEFANHIKQSSPSLGVSPEPFFCDREIRNDQPPLGRLVFRFLPYTHYLSSPNLSRNLGLELIEFLGVQLHDCARSLETFWASGRYSIHSNAVLADVAWTLQQ